MTVLMPCPVCGCDGILINEGKEVRCSNCHLPDILIGDWNRLSRAVQIAEAAEWHVEVQDIDDEPLNEAAFQEWVTISYHAGQAVWKAVHGHES